MAAEQIQRIQERHAVETERGREEERERKRERDTHTIDSHLHAILR